jgi:ABC-type Na+ efflux pump permease subunit
MINLTHLKVLLKKDFITLWRSKYFLLGFIIIPILLMFSFIYIMSLFNKGVKEGSLIYDNFRYTTTKQMGP